MFFNPIYYIKKGKYRKYKNYNCPGPNLHLFGFFLNLEIVPGRLFRTLEYPKDAVNHAS